MARILSRNNTNLNFQKEAFGQLYKRPYFFWQPLRELLIWVSAGILLPGSTEILLHAYIVFLACRCSPLKGLKLLTIQILLINLAPIFGGGAGTSGGLHLVTPLILLLRCTSQPALRHYMTRDPLSRIMLLLLPFFILYQFISSTIPILSSLKGVTFTCFGIVVITLSKAVVDKNYFALFQWILGSITFLIFGSLITLLFGVGRTFEASLFNGIVSHPNTLGIWAGLGTSYLILIAFSRRHLSWIFVAIALGGLVVIYLSGARGGIVILAGSLGIYLVSARHGVKPQSSKFLKQRIILAGALILIALFQSNTFQQVFSDFVLKRVSENSSGKMLDAVLEARSAAIDIHLNLLQKKPLFGHGFQLVNVWTEKGFDQETDSSGYGLIQEHLIQYDPLTGKIPITAPVESGFLYTSIFAENGILGAMLIYSLIIFIVVVLVHRNGRYEKVLGLGFILSNVSEASFFSISGIGGWGWLFLGFAYAVATHQRITRKSKVSAQHRTLTPQNS